MAQREDRPSTYRWPAVLALPASEERRAGLLEAAAAAEAAAGEAAGEAKDRARCTLLPVRDEAAAAAAWL